MKKKIKQTKFIISEKQLDNVIENTCILYEITLSLSKDFRFNKRIISVLFFILGALIVSIIGIIIHFKTLGL